MHGIGFDLPLQKWFDFKVPRTKVTPQYIEQAITENVEFSTKPSAKIVWLGGKPTVDYFTKTKKNRQFEMATVSFYNKKETFSLQVSQLHGQWLLQILPLLTPMSHSILTFQDVKAHYEVAGLEDFELFWYHKSLDMLHKFGLLIL